MNPIRLRIAQATRKVEREPSRAQIEAGNHRKGHVVWNGMHVVVENPVGGERSGVDVHGKPRSTTMQHHYGYVRSTEGADGDPVDEFMGPATESEHVYIIDQRNPATVDSDKRKVTRSFRVCLVTR